jgi:mycofactocin system glycosyltransferase
VTAPLPDGFAVAVDPRVKQLDEQTLFGGSPSRILRLSSAGAAAWAQLQRGRVRSRSAAGLARRLTDAGVLHPVPTQLAGRPDVTVVLPVRDRAAELDRCLASLARTYPVIVVDDASGNGEAIRAVAATHGARVIRLNQNVGPAAARNVGTAAVGSELIAYVDSDTVPGHEWITELSAHFADPAVAAVAPRIVPQTADTSAGRYTRVRCNLDLGPNPARVIPYGRVSYLPTAALLVRCKALSGVAVSDGPFDAAMPIGEDVDLIWRLHEAGWRIRYDPRHQVGHQEPATWRALLHRRRIYGTSTPMLAVRHPEAVSPLLLQPWPTACVAALVARRPAVAVVALAATATRLHASLRKAGVRLGDLPPRTVARGATRSVLRTWEGIGRYLIQFAPALLVAGLLHRRTRLVAAGLALIPPLDEWIDRGRPLDPARFAAGYLADEVAYGAGVVSQSLRERTTVPLRPIAVRRSV